MIQKIYDEYRNEIGYTETWDNIMNKPFKIMLNMDLVRRLGLPLICDDDGFWWLEVNKEKEGLHKSSVNASQREKR